MSEGGARRAEQEAARGMAFVLAVLVVVLAVRLLARALGTGS